MTGLRRSPRIGGKRTTPKGTTSQAVTKWREHVRKERTRRKVKMKLTNAALRRANKDLVELGDLGMNVVPEVNPSPALVVEATE